MSSPSTGKGITDGQAAADPATDRRPVPPRVTVVIPVWNSARWLPECLGHLADQSFDDFEIVVVDNGSTDGATDGLEARWPALEVIRLPSNMGFAAAVNIGIRRSSSEFVALLNADTQVHGEWLHRLVRTLDTASDKVGAVAPLMMRMASPLNRVGPPQIDNAGDAFSWYGSATKVGHGEQLEVGHLERLEIEHLEPVEPNLRLRDVVAVSAGAALYRRSFFEQVGFFDEVFESYLEDVDLSLRGRLLGFSYLCQPTALVFHAGHGSALPRGRYVSLVTRNRLLVMVKNLPGRRLLRHAGQVLWGQLYFFVVYRHPLRSLAGYLGFLRYLGHALRSRRLLRRAAVLPDEKWETLLTGELGEPSLRELMRRRWRGDKT